MDSETTTLRQLILRAADRWPDKVALVFDSTGEEFTFRELESRTNGISHFLVDEFGIKAGDKVALMLPNVAAYPLFWLSLAKIGAVTVPINVGYQEADAQHLLVHSEACLVITIDDKRKLVENIKKASASLRHVVVLDSTGHDAQLERRIAECAATQVESCVDSASITNIQYTSGTTGLPKGCLLPNRYWVEFVGAVSDALRPTLGSDDTILTAQAFSYIDPQWNLIAAIYTGAKLVVLERFRPTLFWQKVAEYQVTFFYCIGAMPVLLLLVPESEYDAKHEVRMVACSGIPKDKHAELERRFNVPWVETYGTTETGADICVWTEEEHAQLVGTGCLGWPAQHREARVVGEAGNCVLPGEVGELILRGPGMMLGYYKNQSATDAVFRDGWYHTGDLARFDDRGRFYFDGRSKDMIRRGGENISAVEVEETLQLHPRVAIAACVPVPDDVREEEVKAFIVLRESADGSSCDVAELIEFAEKKLARFKVPRYWQFCTSLPMTPSERVRKKELHQSGKQISGYDRVTGAWSN